MVELNVKGSIEKVRSFQDIAAYGVMSTPALVIDWKVVFQRMIPKTEDLKEIVSRLTATAS